MESSRRSFLKVASGSLVTTAARSLPRPQQRRPNFVFICTDDQRWDAVRAFGIQPWLRTPNLDRLTREGARFTNAFVTTSLCCPSRASFLTGLYPHKNGVVDNYRSRGLREGVVTVASILHDAGYATGYVGKIHIPGFFDKERGFQYLASFPDQGDYFNNPFTVNGRETPTEGYITDHINRFALEFLRQRDSSQPFLLMVGHKACHVPVLASPKYKDLNNDTYFELPKTWDDTYEGRPAYMAARRKSMLGLDSLLQRYNYSDRQRRIAATLASVDDGVGEILAHLQRSGELDNTVVIFTSDNGFFRGEHGFHDKRAMFEDSIRIPFLVRYPKLARAGSTPAAMILNIDLAPTLLDLAGVEVPGAMQGRSWKATLNGRDKGRDHWLYEYSWEKEYPAEPTQYGVRTRSHKYIRCPDVGSSDPEYPVRTAVEQLYDLESDPLEMRNLASDRSAAGLLKTMRDLLRRTLDETGYPRGYDDAFRG